ncbi:neuroblast differentiation-associated protein AHNAK-like isoform X2 [Oncorhynchus tshawytscha]|uniref:neuroblast differentiation-associated protein AHNAK-like isoform X2 n=1 Tax=Oncorhynchus tshawytscha TaxID=74940 RepID=UPI001C3C6C26|nr:neuroblast differentiation-associated protein AHNAK-like isoform X2 [Oncorhynchus tshawytscha]
MPGVRSGRRLSDGLMLEQSEEGQLVVSSVDDGSLANQGLKEGDEIVGATINFDQLSKDDVLKILRLMDDNGFDEKVQVLTKNNLRKSMGTLDSIKAPEEMLKDSYNRLNAKIKKFMKEDSSGQPTASGERCSPNAQVPRPLWAKPDVRGTDSTVTLNTPGGELSLPNANMSTRDLFLAQLNGSIEADPDVNISNLPSVDLKGSKIDLELPNSDIGIPSGKIKTPSLGRADFAISGPRFRNPDLDLSVDEMCVSDISLPDLNSPDIDIPPGKFKLTKPHAELKASDFDVNAPSGKLKMPKFDNDVKTPKLILKAPTIKGGLDAPDLDLPKVDLKSPKLDVNTPDIDIDSPTGKLKMPKLKMSTFGMKGPHIDKHGDIEGPDLNLSSPQLKGPKADLNIPDADIGRPSGKFKMPTFKMPDLGSSGPKVKGPDFDLSAPKFKAGIDAPDMDLPDMDLKAPKLDVNSPDIDIDSPTGKLKMPKLKMSTFGMKGPHIDKHGDIEGPDLNLSSPQLKGPKADLNIPDADIGRPSGKFKMPTFKMPDLGSSGPKVKGPDFDLSAPKFKAGIDAPDMDLPDMDLKAPKLDVNTPDIDIDSPTGKLKMPKLKMSTFGMKGPHIDKHGDIEGPDLNLSSPNSRVPKQTSTFQMLILAAHQENSKCQLSRCQI